MAIQNRHGTYPYFDKGKMVVGEIAVVTGGDPNTTDGKSVYMCFGNGDCQRFTTAEELADAINRAIEQSEEFQDVVQTTVTETLEDHPEWTTTIQDGAVTTAKIADGAVTSAKLSSSFVTDLTESSSGDDTDLLMVGNRGTTVLRKFTLANLAAYVRDTLTVKTYTQSTGVVPASTLYTVDIDVSDNPATVGMVTGWSIASANWILPLQIYMANKTTIHVRLVNIHASSAQTGNITIYYM